MLYDIHGNLPALEAVLADARAAGAQRWLLGGDYSGFGAWPRACVELLRELPHATWIRGNWERWQASPRDAPDVELVQRSIRYACGALGDDLVRELAGLDQCVSLDGALFCHASPQSDMRGFLFEPADDEDELLAGVGVRRLVVGHTHIQFSRTADGQVELVNPGSVGLPFDGDRRAAYALVPDAGPVELRRVEYDVEAAAAAVRERLGAFAEPTALRIERAAFEV